MSPSCPLLASSLRLTCSLQLRRIALIFAVLVMSMANVGTAWGGTITWDFGNETSSFTRGSNKSFTGSDGKTALTWKSADGESFDGEAPNKYLKMGGKSAISSNIYTGRYFELLAPSSAGTISITYASSNATNANIHTNTNNGVFRTTITAQVSTKCTSSVIGGLVAGTTKIQIVFPSKAYIKAVEWSDSEAPSRNYYSVVKTTLETGASLSLSPSACASEQPGGSGLFSDFTNYYSLSKKEGTLTITPSSPITLNSNGSNRGCIRVYYGSQPFSLNVNGVETGSSYTVVNSTYINVAEYTIPDGTTSLSSFTLVGTGSSTGGRFYAIEVLTYPASPGYKLSVFNSSTNGEYNFVAGTGENEIVINDFVIPEYTAEGDSRQFWVGPGSYTGHATTEYFSWKRAYHQQNNGCTSNLTLGNPVNAIGTLHAWTNSAQSNYGLCFEPNGYGIVWGVNGSPWTNVPFESTGEPTVWLTDIVSLTSDMISNYKYYVGLLTNDGGYVGSFRDQGDARGLSNTDNISGMRRKTASGDNWADGLVAGHGKFRIWVNNCTQNFYCHFVPHYKLTYNANGGEGAPEAAYVSVEETPCQLTVSSTKPTREGYDFLGWNTSSSAASPDGAWDPGDTHAMTGDVTLYAVWNCITPDAPTAEKISVSDQCEGTGVTFTANTSGIPSYVTWYWQDAANGTSTTNSAASGITSATTPGTYTKYLRAKNTVCDTWSDAVSKSATVRTAVTATWGTTPADGTVGGSMTASVTTNYSAGLRFSSSDATVASVNETSGAISYLKAGTTTITATVTGADSYCSTASVNKSITVSAAAPGDGCWDPANDATDKLTSGDESLTKFENNFSGVAGITSVTIQSKGAENAGQCSGADETPTPSGYMKVKNASSSGNKIITIVLSAAKDITIGGQKYGSNTGSFYLVSSTSDIHLAECTTGSIAKASSCPAGTYYVYATADKKSINFSLLCIEDHVATYTVSAAADPDGYGTLSASSIEDVTSGTAISASSNVLTVGASSITATPASATAQYTYAFNNWTKSDGTALPSTVTADLAVLANFTCTTNTYTVTWKNYDGTTLETDEGVAYGATPTYNGSTPTKASTAEYNYTFDAWSPAVVSVTGNATYTATFTQTARNYTLTWVTDGDELTGEYTRGSVAYGTAIVQPNTPTKSGYTFAGWDVTPAATMPAENTTYTATWTPAAGDCHKYFYYCALTTPSPAPIKNENSFFSKVPGDGNALSESWEIDDVTYTTSNRCSNAANIGTFTVPSGKVATMYVMFNGGSSYTMTIKKEGSNYKTGIDASSGIKKYTEKDMGPGTYAVTTSGNVGLLLLIVDVCDDGPDVTAPTLSSSTPAKGATGVGVSGNIVLTFSENVTIVDASKFTLTGGAGTLNTASASASGAVVTIPYSGLAYNTTYTLATAAGAVEDAAGNENAALSSISFTTEAAALEEPTVTWSDVPATVYPGQQFTFTVATNTDATLDVNNLTATNATLVNQSIEGGVFTATAQIAADAAAAPTFTLSTEVGTSYTAKVDTKSGITLGSCASSSGTATLFAFTCTSTTTAANAYTATGGTATLSDSPMATGEKNEITISGQTYYKFNSSSLWTMALSSGTFAAGDVITFTMACSDDKSDKGVLLNNSITVTRDYAQNTAQESSYTVVADDGIAGQNSFTIKRKDADVKFGSVTITRAGQSLDNKQETTIEWPETVDGVRVVEYEVDKKVPSLAIISSIGEATYTSNNEDVGSFREGKVELNGGYGNVTITVSVAAVGCMEAAESSYVLTVTPKRYNVEKGTITADCDVTLSGTSVSSGESVTLTPDPAAGYSFTSWDVHKKGDSSTKVTVTNNRFTMPDYDVVVNATFTAKSTVATLSALSVTNADTEKPVELSPTFESGTTAYTATLSCGTTSAPRISATKADSKATTHLTNVSDLRGDEAARTATIVVSAEDGETTQTYRIKFTVSEEGCVRLAPSITSISEDEDICSGGTVDLSVTAESRNNDGGTLSYQWQKYNEASWDDITGATEADYTTDAITVNSKYRCVVSDTKAEDVKSTESKEITIGVTSIATPTYTQGANVVTLSCATAGATIWYSTDGNDPAADADNSRQGTSVSITRSGVTVKAIAYLEGCRSDVMTLTKADYSSEAVAGSIIWSMKNAGKKEEPKFNVTCVPNTVLSAAKAFTMRNGADYEMSTKSEMSVKISGITFYSEDGQHVSLDVTVADGYTFTPSSLSVTYQPVSKDAKYKAVIGSNTSSESESVSAGVKGTEIVTFSEPSAISGTEALHLYVYGTDLIRWRLAGNIILYGTVQTTGTTYYSVTYNRNGATSGTVPQDDNLYTSSQTVELAANTGNLARTGYIFSGWSTSADGTALTENPTITADMTLYAVWTKDESLVTEVCADVSTSGTHTSIAVGGYSLYFSNSNSEYSSGSVTSSTANTCNDAYRYHMPGVVVALTGSNATTIKLKGQQDYDLTVSKVMVADALDGAWREIHFTPVAYKSAECGEVGISGVQIAQGKYVFLGFTGGVKSEFRISGLCITPFTDLCPSISIAKNPVGDTWAKDATVQISVGATTTSGTLSYQWQVSTDNTNFSDIDAATGTTYDVPTGTVGTKYYRCVVSNGSCSKNSESAKIVIVEPTVTALYEYWYIKQGRMTPDIALFEVTKGTPASNVTIPTAEVGKYSFVYNASDYKIYLQGSAPSEISSDENVEVTASIKSNSNSDNITLRLLRATPHPQLAFVVTGTPGAGFENYDATQTTCDLYTQLALDYIIQPTNIYSTTDEKAIRAYYSQFDIILNTDYPDTQKGPSGDKGQWNVGYVNALGTMVDIVPILTMEAFVSRLPNWKMKHDPKSPSTKQYSMLLNCRAHEIFGGIPDGHMGTEIINGEEHKVVTIVDENGYTGGNALQGFSADELSDMDIVGQIHNGSGQLMACVERQFETTARMMVLGINSAAMVKLTEDGIKVVKNALIYLQHKSAMEVNDCSLRFDNNAGDHQWENPNNWAPGRSTLPTSENKVVILADCELNTRAHVDMVKINEDVKLTIKPTGALIVDGTITRFSGEDWLAQEGEITSDNLAVEANENKTGALILSNPEGKIGAEVQMYSKASGAPNDCKWQWIATPFSNVNRAIEFYYGSWMYEWNAAEHGWTEILSDDPMEPFKGYSITQESPKMYTMDGVLTSTKNREQVLRSDVKNSKNNGINLIGNSWTAPIQIGNFEAADFTNAHATIFILNTGLDVAGTGAVGTNNSTAGQYISIPVEASPLMESTLKVIPAMQTFQVKAHAGGGSLNMDYDRLVRNNAMSQDQINEPMRAPGRHVRKAARINKAEVERLHITIRGSRFQDEVYIFAHPDFSEEFDNGWDGEKMRGASEAVQLFVRDATSRWAVAALPSFVGTYLATYKGEDNEYTISFDYSGEETLYWYDTKTDIYTEINSENTYTYTTNVSSIQTRFMITNENPKLEVPTGMESTKEIGTKALKFIDEDKMYIFVNGRLYDATGKVVK